jgi:hypothetical protein
MKNLLQFTLVLLLCGVAGLVQAETGALVEAYDLQGVLAGLLTAFGMTMYGLCITCLVVVIRSRRGLPDRFESVSQG